MGFRFVFSIIILLALGSRTEAQSRFSFTTQNPIYGEIGDTTYGEIEFINYEVSVITVMVSTHNDPNFQFYSSTQTINVPGIDTMWRPGIAYFSFNFHPQQDTCSTTIFCNFDGKTDTVVLHGIRTHPRPDGYVSPISVVSTDSSSTPS